jgi:UDP-N-acetyl-D-mannosaminuronic acid dehydrogenase
MLFPGAGVGGHCIPKDPWLLASSVADADVPIRLIPAARAVNSGMPGHVFGLVERELGDLKGKKVLLLGYAYLQDSDDTRNSPSADLEALLKEAGASVVVHDPYIEKYDGDVYEMAADCDMAVLMTAHGKYKDLDLGKMAGALNNPVIIDGRNLLDAGAAEAAGLTLVRLGVGRS